MGGWKLEVFRMAGYVALPILCFYLFNKPEYFKEFLIRNKRFQFFIYSHQIPINH